MNPITQHTIATALGPVHVARCRQGVPLLLLHQAPRSWRESLCPYVDAERRARHVQHAVVDGVAHRADGGHLLDLWRGRQGFFSRR